MHMRKSRGRTPLVFLSVVVLLSAPGGVLSAFAQQPAAKPAATTAMNPGNWPRRYTVPDGAQVLVYEPQVASWADQKTLTLHAAVAYTAKGKTSPLLGTIMAEADTRVSVDDRLVDFSSFRIIQSNFPGASREEAAAAVDAIKDGMPAGARVIALDLVLASVDASSIRPRNVDGVKADPPVIFFSTRPALLVNLDGGPVWSPIQGNDLRFAVNTNWDLFEYPPSKAYYLRNDTTWLTATNISGPWTAAGTLPASFSQAARRRELERGACRLARARGRCRGAAHGVREHDRRRN